MNLTADDGIKFLRELQEENKELKEKAEILDKFEKEHGKGWIEKYTGGYIIMTGDDMIKQLKKLDDATLALREKSKLESQVKELQEERDILKKLAYRDISKAKKNKEIVKKVKRFSLKPFGIIMERQNELNKILGEKE